MSLSILNLDNGTPYSWAIMPAFLERIKKFTGTHMEQTEDPLPAVCAAAVGSHLPEVLMLVILDDSKENVSEALVGHVVAGVETFLGRRVGMVYQFEKTGNDPGWRDMNKSIQAMIDLWARNGGLDEILAMAETDSRAKLFAQFGYVRGPVLLRRKFNG
jgi:hypothetical protein